MTGQEMLVKLMGRLATLPESSGLSFLDAMNTAVEVVFLRLWARRSDIVKAPLAVATAATPFFLPEDFRGFAEDPYLVAGSGKALPLVPLPSGGERDLYGATGAPSYYKLTGRTLQLFPYDIDRELRGAYFSSPGELAITDTIPWNGVVDALLCDAVIAASRFGGISSLLANQEFMVTMDQALDGILTSRNNPAPRRVRPHFF